MIFFLPVCLSLSSFSSFCCFPVYVHHVCSSVRGVHRLYGESTLLEHSSSSRISRLFYRVLCLLLYSFSCPRPSAPALHRKESCSLVTSLKEKHSPKSLCVCAWTKRGRQKKEERDRGVVFSPRQMPRRPNFTSLLLWRFLLLVKRPRLLVGVLLTRRRKTSVSHPSRNQNNDGHFQAFLSPYTDTPVSRYRPLLPVLVWCL